MPIFTRAFFDSVRRKAVPCLRAVEKRRWDRLAEVITGARSLGGAAGVLGGVAGSGGAEEAGGWDSSAPMSGVAIPSPLPSAERGGGGGAVGTRARGGRVGRFRRRGRRPGGGCRRGRCRPVRRRGGGRPHRGAASRAGVGSHPPRGRRTPGP